MANCVDHNERGNARESASNGENSAREQILGVHPEPRNKFPNDLKSAVKEPEFRSIEGSDVGGAWRRFAARSDHFFTARGQIGTSVEWITRGL